MRHFFLSVVILGGVILCVTGCKKDNDAKSYTITASTNANGIITPDGAVIVNSGSSQRFMFTANSGYEVDELLVDGVSVPDSMAGNSYTFVNVTENHSIVVSFKLKIPSELIRTWKAVSVDGKTIVTDKTKVLKIKDNERADLMERLVYETVPVWQTMPSVISYANDTLKITGVIDNPFTRVVQTYKIMELTGDRLKMKLLSEVVNSYYKPDNIGQEIVFEQVPSNVEAKIVGMWKTTTTYELDPFGLYFKNTGDYDYYYYDSQGGSTLKSGNEGYYWFYGNFIVLRYKNAPNTDDQKQYVECWNVKLVETNDPDNPKNMTLTTLHEDGTTETVPFRWIGVL